MSVRKGVKKVPQNSRTAMDVMYSNMPYYNGNTDKKNQRSFFNSSLISVTDGLTNRQSEV